MKKMFISKRAITQMQTIAIIVVVILAAVAVVGYSLMMPGKTTTTTTTTTTTSTTTTTTSSTTPVAEKVTVEMWTGLTGGDGYVMDMLVDEFNTAYEGKIEVTHVVPGYWADVYAKLTAAYKAGTGLPDITICHYTQREYFKDTIAQPIEDLVQSAGLTRDKFIGLSWDLAQSGGHMYFIPWDVHDHSMYVNVKMAEEYNITLPKAGELSTPDKLLDWYREARAKLPEGKYPYGHASWGDWEIWWSFLPEDILTSDGIHPDIRVNTPEGIAAYKVFQTMYDEKLVKVHTWEELAAGLGGDCLTWITGPWMQATFDQISGFDYAVIPILGPEYPIKCDGHCFYFTRANGDARTQAALTFVEWMLKTANNGRWGQYAGHVPAVLSAQTYPPYSSIPHRMAFQQQAALGFKLLPLWPYYTEWADVVNTKLLAILGGTLTAEDAASQTQKECEDIVKAHE